MLKCKKCGGDMRDGKAIAQTVTGMPDFPGDRHAVTLSAGGPGMLINCLKCSICGWSMTIPALPFNAVMSRPAGAGSIES